MSSLGPGRHSSRRRVQWALFHHRHLPAMPALGLRHLSVQLLPAGLFDFPSCSDAGSVDYAPDCTTCVARGSEC
jgi:hypothetical protein